MLKPFDYYKLQLRLLKKARKRVFPLKAMFELTYRCNLRCRHCYVADGSKRKELSTPEVFSILKDLASAGCLNIGFTGGEPFLRKDILDILEYAKGMGLNIIILTNGTLITAKKADRLKDLVLNKIDVSFHTTKKEIFDWFTKVPDTYRRVLRAIKLLRERGIEVYLKTTAMSINKDDIVKIRHFAVERFGAYFRWGPIVTPRWDGRKDNLKFRLLPEEINQLMKEVQNDTEIEFEKLDALEKKKRKKPQQGKRRERNINHNRLFHCGAGMTETVINPYGEMRLCMDIHEPKYNILKGSFRQGWNMLSSYVKNTPPGPNYQCRDCEFIQYCKFCPAVGYLESGDMSACAPYYREAACLAKMEAVRKQG